MDFSSLYDQGFARVAACTVPVAIADPARNAETVLGIELMCAAQGLEFLKPLHPGAGVERAYRAVRERIQPLGRDRVLAPDIAAATALVRDGLLSSLT